MKRTPNPWEKIEFVKKFNPAKKVDKNKNPEAGLMEMMKEMYDQGDDNMKRTITEAFVKAQQGKKN